MSNEMPNRHTLIDNEIEATTLIMIIGHARREGIARPLRATTSDAHTSVVTTITVQLNINKGADC
eukprot:3272555-Pleurochrysis_carterae.AAC.1